MLFNGTNYHDWVHHMRDLRLWEFLTSELPYPPSPSVPAQLVISEKTTTNEKKKLLADYDDRTTTKKMVKSSRLRMLKCSAEGHHLASGSKRALGIASASQKRALLPLSLRPCHAIVEAKKHLLTAELRIASLELRFAEELER
jgi:hypothetical protein